MSRGRPLEIVVAASEALPYCKTGGLADVVTSLAKSLASQGCRVHIFLPLYRAVRRRLSGETVALERLEIETGEGSTQAAILSHSPSPGVTAWFVAHDGLYDREGLYGDAGGDYADNDLRFSTFCRAVVAAVGALRLDPHVIHCHDWQTALIPLYLRHRPEMSRGLSAVPTLLTIHNLSYQGLFPRSSLGTLGIPEGLFAIEGVEFYGKVNLLKGGILSADALTTVSPRYSREIQTEPFGDGLHGVLKGRAGVLRGILNGIDYEVWDPASDSHLPARYGAGNLSGKVRCKEELLRSFGLAPDTGPPLMATISRLVEQKGFDIIVPALPGLLDLGFRYVLLGAGDSGLERALSEVARRRPREMAVRIGYDEELSHLVEAGADFFLMPSRFEPCGLNQMYSLRYGTIPIVRAVGGLDDTVSSYQPLTGAGNGLKFSEYTPGALALKAHEAFLIYRRPDHMKRLILNAMSSDCSWRRSASLYVDLYRRLASGRGP